MDRLIDELRAEHDWHAPLIASAGEAVIEAAEDGTLAELLERTRDVDVKTAPNLGFLVTLGAARLGEDPTAMERLTSLIEKLNQSGRWDALAHAAFTVLQALDDPTACRYVARAGEEGGLAALPEGALQLALLLAPENHRLLWLKGSELEAAGDATAAEFFARSLVGWARAKEIARVEDGVLKLLERPSRVAWAVAWTGLDYLARQGDTGPVLGFLEFAMHEIEEFGLMDQVWKTLRRILEGGDRSPEIRRLAARAAEGSHRKIASIARVVDKSGLSTSGVPIQKALAEFDRLLKYAPGLLAVHSGWGVGTIRDNDGETLLIDFPQKPGHRMTLAIADRSLDILPPDDLRTYILTDPDRLKRMASDDPVGLLLLALRKAGGEASGSEVRKLLVPDVLSAQAWPTWWKKASGAAASDDRIDSSQTFRKVYRIQEESGGASLLPPIQEKADLHQNLEMIHRFLSQHPEAEAEARRVYRPRLANWLGSTEKIEARVHLLNVLRRWDESAQPAFVEALGALLTGGGDFSFTALASEQLDLLTAAEETGLGPEAALAAFPSRHSEVRQRAAELLLRVQGDQCEHFIRDLYSSSPEDANRILGLVEFVSVAPGALPVALADPWQAARAIIAIVNLALREPLRRRAMALLKAGGALSRHVASAPLDEQNALLLEQQLTAWRTTDRHLFPVFEFLEASGAGDVVERVRQHRSVQSARLVTQEKDSADTEGRVLMTRRTLERLRDEITQIELALRTTIPETIRRARELGDLSENAEYDAAKLKQQQYNARLAELQALITMARAIEDLQQVSGLSGPGTEVVTQDAADASEHTYWILGEGDSNLGPNVVSYRAPLGAALSGHHEGDEVTVTLDGGERRLRILTVRPRLP